MLEPTQTVLEHGYVRVCMRADLYRSSWYINICQSSRERTGNLTTGARHHGQACIE